MYNQNNMKKTTPPHYFFFAILILPVFAAAQIDPSLNPSAYGDDSLETDQSINSILVWSYYFFVGIAGLASFVMLIWGGVQWLTSGAIPSQASEAKVKVRNALFGLLVILGSFWVIRIIYPDLVILGQDGVGSQSREVPRAPYPASSIIRDVSFDRGSHIREAEGSDNWPTTWADDGHLYTAWGDGGGFGGSGKKGRVSLGVARVEGSASNYQGHNVNGGISPEGGTTWPDNGDEGKSYGMLSLSGDLYMWVTGGKRKNLFSFVSLYRSDDKGRTWSNNGNSVRFTEEGEGLSVPTILNFGQDYAGARDNFVYHYFIETQGQVSRHLRVNKPGRIHLLRVDRNSMMNKSAYEYFSGTPQNPSWSSNRSASVPVFEDPNGVGWNVAASYNAGLGRYILTTEHTQSHDGWLGIFDAPEPWGPWTTVLYDNNGNWENFNGSTDGSFYWNFPTKWISADGKSFTMVFTGGNPGDLDSWNTINGTFTTAPPATTPPTAGSPPASTGPLPGSPSFIDNRANSARD